MAPATSAALAPTCSLRPTAVPSNGDEIARQAVDELAAHGIEGGLVRVVDFDARPGVQTDVCGGDRWSSIGEWTPDPVTSTNEKLASNAVHPARLLEQAQYPPIQRGEPA